MAGTDAAKLPSWTVVVCGAGVWVDATAVGHTELVGQAVGGRVFALGCANVLVAVAVGATLCVRDTGFATSFSTHQPTGAVCIAFAGLDAEAIFAGRTVSTVCVCFAQGTFGVNTSEATRAFAGVGAGAS